VRNFSSTLEYPGKFQKNFASRTADVLDPPPLIKQSESPQGIRSLAHAVRDVPVEPVAGQSVADNTSGRFWQLRRLPFGRSQTCFGTVVGGCLASNSAGVPGPRTRFVANVSGSFRKGRQRCSGQPSVVCSITSLGRAGRNLSGRVIRPQRRFSAVFHVWSSNTSAASCGRHCLSTESERLQRTARDNPTIERMVDRSDLQVVGLEAAERPLDTAQRLRRPHQTFGAHRLGGHRCVDGRDPIPLRLGGDPWLRRIATTRRFWECFPRSAVSFLKRFRTRPYASRPPSPPSSTQAEWFQTTKIQVSVQIATMSFLNDKIMIENASWTVSEGSDLRRWSVCRVAPPSD
jgi:hypothetical protein